MDLRNGSQDHFIIRNHQRNEVRPLHSRPAKHLRVRRTSLNNMNPPRSGTLACLRIQLDHEIVNSAANQQINERPPRQSKAGNHDISKHVHDFQTPRTGPWNAIFSPAMPRRVNATCSLAGGVLRFDNAGCKNSVISMIALSPLISSQPQRPLQTPYPTAKTLTQQVKFNLLDRIEEVSDTRLVAGSNTSRLPRSISLTISPHSRFCPVF